MIRSLIVSAALVLVTAFANAQEQNMVKSANLDAPKGGVVTYNLMAEPPTIHPLTSTYQYSGIVRSYILDSLMDINLDTYEYIPRIAEKFEVSKDGKVFTFFLRPGVKFHDGTPVTAEDVKFSFDAIFEPKYHAAHMIPYYQGIEKAEIVNPTTVKFYTKEKYFKNLEVVATLTIIPKHVYGDVEKSKKMNTTLVGSGPYILEKFDRGQKIVLKRNENWVGINDPTSKGFFNFDKIEFRFYKDANVSIEHIKKGDLDYINESDFLSEAYYKKAVGPEWGKTVFKHKVSNALPKGYLFIGWNMKQDLFKEKDVRLALAHLMNRDEINRKFRYNDSNLATGPVEVDSEYHSTKLKPIMFDPAKAQELLTKAGWSDSDKDGVLDRMVNGKKVDFRFTLIYPAKDAEKYWTLYKEDLKKAGIDMQLKFLEWNAFSKALEKSEFDAVTLAWGGGSPDPDLKQIWHSASAVQGGSNFINYKNAEVDKLIDKARGTMDKKQRIEIVRQIDEMIAEDAPYIFMFNNKFQYYARTKRIERPGDTFRFGVGSATWWMKKQ